MSLEELALCCLNFEPMLHQLLKHSLKPSEVVCDTAAVHDDVVQVHQEDLQQFLAEDFCINFWKRAGTLQNPKGMRLYSNKPIVVVIAVLCRSSWCTSTWLYPDARSIAEKYRALPRASTDSSTLGRGKASFLVLALSQL